LTGSSPARVAPPAMGSACRGIRKPCRGDCHMASTDLLIIDGHLDMAANALGLKAENQEAFG